MYGNNPMRCIKYSKRVSSRLSGIFLLN